MCGFAGFLSFDERSRSEDRRIFLERMGAAIAHRGPDETTMYDDGILGLVFTRLSIVDVAHGSQPIGNEAGDCLIAVNGEIYNHDALRTELARTHAFRTRSDSEVPLHAFEQWGDRAFALLNGMFALAIWDRRRRVLTLARDRLGIKPLYVCRLPHGILFGSELKGLLAHPDCPRELDWRVVDRASMGRLPKDTFVQGVEFLPGGELLTVAANTGHIAQHRYWSLDDRIGAAPFGDDAAAYVGAYAELLETATHEHLQGEVGAGLHLSGGLDSSLLAALVARHAPDAPCFTIVERTSVLGGDVASARALTRRLGLPWHPVRVDYRRAAGEMQFDLARFEQAVWMMDSPRFDLEWLLKEELHRSAKVASPGIKVVLLGQGADEFAGGYSRRHDALRADWAAYLRDEVVPNLSYHDEIERAGSGHLWPWLADPRRGDPDAPGPYHRMMGLHVRQLQQHNLWHEDRTSAWHGLEARVPFLDHRLVELLASVPASLHERLFWDKAIVRAAMQRALPGWAFVQPKIGFLGAADEGSLDLIRYELLLRIVPAFVEKYIDADPFGAFDATKLRGLLAASLRRGPAFREDAARAFECMAIAVFQRLCRDASPPVRGERPVLPVIAAAEHDRIEAQFAGPMAPSEPLPAATPFRLREGAQIAALLDAGDRRRFIFLVDGRAAGHLAAPNGHPWLDRLLEGLGAGTVRSLAEWANALATPEAELITVAGMLQNSGLIERTTEAPNGAGPATAITTRVPVTWH